MERNSLEDAGLIPPPKEIEIIKEREFVEHRRYINDLLGTESNELREQLIADIVKNVPAFQEVAKIIAEKGAIFLIGTVTVSVIKKEKHMISLLSSELDGLPVFVKPIECEEDKCVYNIIVPATQQLIEDNDRNPNKIAVAQFEIIKSAIPEEYKSGLHYIRLDSRTPFPIIKMFNRCGFWTVWEIYMDMKDFNELWLTDVCGTRYMGVQPFIMGTDKFEYVMILNEEIYKQQFDTLMAKLRQNLVKKNGLKLQNTFTFHISYGWLLKFGVFKESSKKREKNIILSSLSRKIPILRRGIPSAHLGEEKHEYDNVNRIIRQPIFSGLKDFTYSDEVTKKCIISWRG